MNYVSGTMRLVGGTSDREGRLEVYHDGVWGTVCDDVFNNVAARVACNSLGFGSATDISFQHNTTSTLVSLNMSIRKMDYFCMTFFPLDSTWRQPPCSIFVKSTSPETVSDIK